MVGKHNPKKGYKIKGGYSRRKGVRFERQIASRLREIGYCDCMTSRAASKMRDDQCVDFVNTGPFNIQAKNAAAGVNAFRIIWEDMPSEPDKINVLVWKRAERNKRSPICVLFPVAHLNRARCFIPLPGDKFQYPEKGRAKRIHDMLGEKEDQVIWIPRDGYGSLGAIHWNHFEVWLKSALAAQ